MELAYFKRTKRYSRSCVCERQRNTGVDPICLERRGKYIRQNGCGHCCTAMAASLWGVVETLYKGCTYVVVG